MISMKISRLKKILFFTFSLSLFFFIPPDGFAQEGVETENQKGVEVVSLDNPISYCDAKTEDCVPVIAGNVIQTILGIVGSLALLAFVVGGFRWLLSGGNEEQIKKGSKTMLYAVIGLFVVFASYGILNTVLSALKGG